ncbi:MAG: hypothetical protein JNL73_21950 [Anaerolineales bacterium]|nr:hypothetical protein [Anaerolineales bacterium]
MNKTQLTCLAAAAALALAACSPPKPGTAVEFGDACGKAGERVQVTGYPVLPDTIEGDTVNLWVYELAPYEGEVLEVTLSIGSGANEVGDVEDQFADEDLQLTAGDGKTVYTFGETAKFSGDVKEGGTTGACVLTNVLVE